MPPADVDANAPPRRRRMWLSADARMMASAVLKTIARLCAVWAAAHWADVLEFIRRR